MSAPVFIVGASGVFGSHLARQLAATGTRQFVLAGRSEQKAGALVRELEAQGCSVSFAAFDRNRPDMALLQRLAPRVVVDAAGPFQQSSLALPEACIAARIPYIDLADARDFVAQFASLDAMAKAAGVALITGASSTPALSHAVLDELTAGWRKVHSVLVAISPGNRAPRGRSVVEAILSYVGEPVRVFRGGEWQTERGWGLGERVEINGIGQRAVALCETPDLDLLVQRYQPLLAAEFKAGLELGVMQRGLQLLSWLRGHKLLPPLRRFAAPLQRLADWLSPFGSDVGGMLVSAAGRDAAGVAVKARWCLSARGGIGPVIPCLPAVELVNRIGSLAAGARSAAGELTYLEMMSHFNRFGISFEVQREELLGPDLFEQALGQGWDELPGITRAIHRATPSILLRGEADVEGAETWAGRIIAKGFGFPEAAKQVPLRVVIERRGAAEYWQRIYPTRTMRSVMTRPNATTSSIEEWLGPFRFTLALRASALGIDMVPQALRLWRLPLPLWVLPRIVATERASADGACHLFDVHNSAPIVGRLVHYRGWLKPVSAT